MIRLDITEEQISRAKELYEFTRLNNSILDGGGNLTGAIGEVVVADWLEAQGLDVDRSSSCFDFDMIVEGLLVDVKTKKTNCIPQPEYYCYIPKTQEHQKCEIYIFAILKGQKECFLLGYKQKADFFEVAEFWKEGVHDPNNPDFVFRCDTYSIRIKQLERFKVDRVQTI